MRRLARKHIATVAGLAVFLAMGVANAQQGGAAGAGAQAGAKAGGGAPGGQQGYGYEFTDDPLNAGGFGPTDATIRVRPGPLRTTLIRPRTSFVHEMLKSVENL